MFSISSHPFPDVFGNLRLAQERRHQVRGVRRREWGERKGGRVLLARTPRRAHLEQLDSGRAEQQHLRVGEVLRELFEEVGERARGPVDVLDGDDRQLLAPESRDIPRPPVLQPPDDFSRIAAWCRATRKREPDRPRGRLEYPLGLIL